MRPDLHLKKNQKITTKREYDENIKNGKKRSGAFLSVYIAPGEQKFGIIISRKIKGAVVRNRYKRLIREYVRRAQHTLSNNKNYVIILFKKVMPDKYCTIEREMDKLMHLQGEHGTKQ
ncbi:ribonuclease P protein component [candidate division FCPU426 bacterium]|nr:ribonuclease P protein component [candidate division FCPU426 bacterium]